MLLVLVVYQRKVSLHSRHKINLAPGECWTTLGEMLALSKIQCVVFMGRKV